ncbi:hypothetical protein AMTR_s00095p00153570 [Amborella trichopoda]|uniref:Uncharacterized protein n=1 Tax=Amborella trichopoda TaxID=13333 RepID=W1NUA3_AMBTC|nr:hypothetical protein AMTR_s00095p00153570 [Amborella trichopoda]
MVDFSRYGVKNHVGTRAVDLWSIRDLSHRLQIRKFKRFGSPKIGKWIIQRMVKPSLMKWGIIVVGIFPRMCREVLVLWTVGVSMELSLLIRGKGTVVESSKRQNLDLISEAVPTFFMTKCNRSPSSLSALKENIFRHRSEVEGILDDCFSDKIQEFEQWLNVLIIGDDKALLKLLVVMAGRFRLFRKAAHGRMLNEEERIPLEQ